MSETLYRMCHFLHYDISYVYKSPYITRVCGETSLTSGTSRIPTIYTRSRPCKARLKNSGANFNNLINIELNSNGIETMYGL